LFDLLFDWEDGGSTLLARIPFDIKWIYRILLLVVSSLWEISINFYQNTQRYIPEVLFAVSCLSPPEGRL
jgi:hypothetical protein